MKFLESFVGPLEGRAEGTRIGDDPRALWSSVPAGPRSGGSGRRTRRWISAAGRPGATRGRGFDETPLRRAARGKFAGARFGVSAEAGATAAGAARMPSSAARRAAGAGDA